MIELLRYFQGYMKETLLGPFFKLLEASFELMVPLIIAHMVDVLIPKGETGGLFGLIALLVFLALLGVVVAITAQYYSSKAAVGFARKLTQDLYEKILSLSKTSRDELTTSSLVTRLTSDTYQIQMGINQFLRLFLRAPIIVFGSIIMAYTISSRLTVWFLMMVGVLVFIVAFMSRIVNPLYASIRKLTDRIVNGTRQQFEGMRVIRAFGQTKREIREFRQVNELYKMWQIRAGIFSSLISPLTFLVVNGTLMIVIWNGYGELQLGNLSQGMLVALVNYLLQILTELLKLALLVTNLNQSFISARRIQQVFEEKEEDIEAALPQTSALPNQALLLQEVSFTYPNAALPSLITISLDLQKGQTLGIIGGTGSGKSTLVQLLSHLYKPSQGTLTVFYKGRSPKTLKEWRSWVSIVPQKAQLFRGSIRSNLLLGIERTVTDEEIWQALRIAQAADFVKEKAGGLEEPVASFGRNFSGGQRQRLTIARALLRQSPFLILDDATSALDYLTESKLLKAIKSELLDTTLILISQRTKSLKNADTILVLDQGIQVGLGRHMDLLENNSLYQEIHYSQHGSEEKV
ncbi:ABC transporter ATP-binding protein [Streptococcus sp. DD10]|uniref:ABC transporter ATP-binding protein n=1 Tax=Streptococcus sp. DD10 TaxID=1777878 RepID=UPI0008297E2F|nr:ABC transporter ATP-binding protein [Streptococcus sp. DD10]